MKRDNSSIYLMFYNTIYELSVPTSSYLLLLEFLEHLFQYIPHWVFLNPTAHEPSPDDVPHVEGLSRP